MKMIYNIKSEPIIKVGIGSFTNVEIATSVASTINGISIDSAYYTISYRNGNASIVDSNEREIIAAPEITLIQSDIENGYVEIANVEIGIQFHWNKREPQRFNGIFRFVAKDEKILVINEIRLENYLTSVISSEMNGDNNPELLKAHAVVSRSWLLSQIYGQRPQGRPIITDEEICTWHDKEEHQDFDVCADDHCQRYQGITRSYNPNVQAAISDTKGIVLSYKGEICDARFSKCCGGTTELFENCWQPQHYDYLEPVNDPYCNTNDRNLLSKILNDYDYTTKNFHHWTVKLPKKTLASLIYKKTGIDFGEIIALTPLTKGPSGRITRMMVKGTLKTMIFGKELEIRRILSETHLYSSAFDVEQTPDAFVLHGKGWGHGVGMCQIGAAVMSEKGFPYSNILTFYYLKAELTKLY